MMALRIRSKVALAALVTGTRGVLLVIWSSHMWSMTRTWDLSCTMFSFSVPLLTKSF
jgi:hypothetical protein